MMSICAGQGIRECLLHVGTDLDNVLPGTVRRLLVHSVGDGHDVFRSRQILIEAVQCLDDRQVQGRLAVRNEVVQFRGNDVPYVADVAIDVRVLDWPHGHHQLDILGRMQFAPLIGFRSPLDAITSPLVFFPPGAMPVEDQSYLIDLFVQRTEYLE